MKAGFLKILAAMLLLWPACLGATAVGEVKVESEGGKTTLKVVSTSRLSPTLERAGSRLVLHLKGAERGNLDTIKIGRHGVRQIRFGKHPGELRMVVDLEGPAPATAKIAAVTDAGFQVDWDSAPEPTAEAAKAAPPAEEALAPTQAGLTYRVVDVALQKGAEKIQVVISTDGPASYKTAVKEGGKLLVITVRNATLSWTPPEQGMSEAPVEKISVRPFTSRGEAQVLVEVRLKEKTAYAVNRDQNQVVVTLERPQSDSRPAATRGDLEMPVTLEVEQADLIGTIKMLATQAGFETEFSKTLIDLSPESRLVTFSARKRPLREVLASLLLSFNANFDLQGNVLFVGTLSELTQKKQGLRKVIKEYSPRYLERSQLVDLVKIALAGDPLITDVASLIATDPRDSSRVVVSGSEGDVARVLALFRQFDVPEKGEEAAEGSGSSIKTKVYTLRYLDSRNQTLLQDAITKIIPTGVPFTYSLDTTSRILIVNTTMKYLKKIDQLLERLDKKRPQVRIEGKVVQVNQDDAREMGIDWGHLVNRGGGNFTQFDVNASPANAGIGVITHLDTIGLNTLQARIDALVTKDRAEILSSPNVTTQDNYEAVITVEDRVVTATRRERDLGGGLREVTNEFNQFRVPLELKVKPTINLEDRNVEMVIKFTLDTIVRQIPLTGAPPDVVHQETTTIVTVGSQETAVIGGLLRDSLTNSESKVPVLGDIPLLGLLFKSNTVRKQKKEILIFITPTIIEE